MPGRVNLIGEHTDYNHGLVLPFAIGRALRAVASSQADGVIRVCSVADPAVATFHVDVDDRLEPPAWENYLRGVVIQLRHAGVALQGADVYIGGDLPIGSGLSSSAALCVGFALALIRLAQGRDWVPTSPLPSAEIVGIAYEAERFAGTPCGMMDPYVCVHAQAGHALLIDCRTMTHRLVPLELPGHDLVVIQSGVRHALAGSAYAVRVRECREAVEYLQRFKPTAGSLRDMTLEDLDAGASSMPPTLLRRARHVIMENARVEAVVEALGRNDMSQLGLHLNASHESLRDEYEVSCDEIERLRDAILEHPGVLGARMFGGGFGGAILALVRHENSVGLVDGMLDPVGTVDSHAADAFPIQARGAANAAGH